VKENTAGSKSTASDVQVLHKSLDCVIGQDGRAGYPSTGNAQPF